VQVMTPESGEVAPCDWSRPTVSLRTASCRTSRRRNDRQPLACPAPGHPAMKTSTTT